MTHTLTVRDKLDAFIGWVSVGKTEVQTSCAVINSDSTVAEVIYAAATGFFRGPSGADTYHHHLIQAVVKKVVYYVACGITNY
jgi:hypothetical protein